MEAVYGAIRDVDLLIHMIDASEKYGKGEEFVLDLIEDSGKTAFLLLNKIDLINKGRLLPIIEFYSGKDVYAEIVPISAAEGTSTDLLLDLIVEHLPESEALFPDETLTDMNERFLTAELIREKVLALTRQELPYSTAVQIEQFDETRREEGFVRIAASIIVDKPTQKKIVIGRSGRMIKQIGIDARKQIQDLLQIDKIYLELNVKVVPGWRNQDRLLDERGVG
jgi:GTP-binding protein Era